VIKSRQFVRRIFVRHWKVESIIILNDWSYNEDLIKVSVGEREEERETEGKDQIER
jgi:hypothetical protein